ncbi:MAG: hydrolase [Myxococcaceae bacterium]
MPSPPVSPFHPAPGLTHPHAQTVFATLVRKGARPPLRRERWETPDGDFLDVDLLEKNPTAPTVIVLHGLEGSSEAGYVVEILRGAAARNWNACALNFRGCSGEPNRLPISYHSGAVDDPRWVLQQLRDRARGSLYAVGFSLGGNVLLKLLADTGDSSLLTRAAAISVPFDLARCAQHLDRPGDFWTGIYRRRFLRTLKAKALANARRHPGPIRVDRVRAAQSLWEFDDAVTAPLHGFASAKDYYAKSSSGPMLDRIRRPTLLISAKDDPFTPFPIPPAAESNPLLSVLNPPHGGHVGFVGGTLLRPRYWAEEQALSFLDAATD